MLSFMAPVLGVRLLLVLPVSMGWCEVLLTVAGGRRPHRAKHTLQQHVHMDSAHACLFLLCVHARTNAYPAFFAGGRGRGRRRQGRLGGGGSPLPPRQRQQQRHPGPERAGIAAAQAQEAGASLEALFGGHAGPRASGPEVSPPREGVGPQGGEVRPCPSRAEVEDEQVVGFERWAGAKIKWFVFVVPPPPSRHTSRLEQDFWCRVFGFACVRLVVFGIATHPPVHPSIHPSTHLSPEICVCFIAFFFFAGNLSVCTDGPAHVFFVLFSANIDIALLRWFQNRSVLADLLVYYFVSTFMVVFFSFFPCRACLGLSCYVMPCHRSTSSRTAPSFFLSFLCAISAVFCTWFSSPSMRDRFGCFRVECFSLNP